MSRAPMTISKTFRMRSGGPLAAESGPSDVVIHRARRVELRPQVDQDEVAVPDHARAVPVGAVVRIAAVLVRGHDRPVHRDHALLAEAARDEARDLVLGRTAARIDLRADLAKGVREHGVDPAARLEVGLPLPVGPARLEVLHERGRRDDLGSEGPHQIDRAGIDERHDGNHAARGVLHGDAPGAGEDRSELPDVRLPARVDALAAGQAVQARILDGMHELGRFAARGDPVVPAPRDVGAGVEAEDAVRDRIAHVVVEQEPAVKALRPQLLLDEREIHSVRS